MTEPTTQPGLKPTGHTVYKCTDGKRVPGVTTIIDIIAKPQLITWANKMGLDGIDTTKYVDELGDVGTLVHHLILCKFKGAIPDTDDFTANQIMMASNSMVSFENWLQQHQLEPILVEQPIVSESLRIGGTPDLLCNLDGVPTLIDFKSGKALHFEVLLQLAAYRYLLKTQDWEVEQAIALRIGRESNEGFEVVVFDNDALGAALVTFMLCLDLYKSVQQTRKNYWKH